MLFFCFFVFLARLDACWIVGDVVGSLIAPNIYKYLGYYGVYTGHGGCLLIALVYLCFVKEPIKKVTEPFDNKLKLLKRIFVDSVKDMFQTLIKKRIGWLRFLLFIQLISYSLLWFNWEYASLEYLYMLKTFEGTNNNFQYFFFHL